MKFLDVPTLLQISTAFNLMAALAWLVLAKAFRIAPRASWLMVARSVRSAWGRLTRTSSSASFSLNSCTR